MRLAKDVLESSEASDLPAAYAFIGALIWVSQEDVHSRADKLDARAFVFGTDVEYAIGSCGARHSICFRFHAS